MSRPMGLAHILSFKTDSQMARAGGRSKHSALTPNNFRQIPVKKTDLEKELEELKI